MKKVNAYLSLLSMILLGFHAIYEISAYAVLYYNPGISQLSGYLAGGVIAIHAAVSIINLFLLHDSKTIIYWKFNIGMIIQRVSAGIMLILLPIHICSFDLLNSSFGSIGYFFVEAAQIFFFTALFAHIAVSFSKALISLGFLLDDKKRRIIDKAVILFCAAATIITILVTVRTHGIMLSA